MDDVDVLIGNYATLLADTIRNGFPANVNRLCRELICCGVENKQVFICGNGGSAANAIHMANDLMCIGGDCGSSSLRVEAISSNVAVLLCLANDLDYSYVFSKQLEVKAGKGDILIVLSGSGNSPNVVRALEYGNSLGMKTFAILGFDGGICKKTAEFPIHFAVDDMQISEDLQVVVGHICMKFLKENMVPRT